MPPCGIWSDYIKELVQADYQYKFINGNAWGEIHDNFAEDLIVQLMMEEVESLIDQYPLISDIVLAPASTLNSLAMRDSIIYH